MKRKSGKRCLWCGKRRMKADGRSYPSRDRRGGLITMVMHRCSACNGKVAIQARNSGGRGYSKP